MTLRRAFGTEFVAKQAAGHTEREGPIGEELASRAVLLLVARPDGCCSARTTHTLFPRDSLILRSQFPMEFINPVPFPTTRRLPVEWAPEASTCGEEGSQEGTYFPGLGGKVLNIFAMS
jgi:hypothetical protein